MAAIKRCRDKDLESGRAIHKALHHPPSAAIATSLIDMYAKCGSAIEAAAAFDAIPDRDRDVACWNAIIHGMAIAGHGAAALEYFDRFIADARCQRPDYITFLAAIKACWSSIDRSRGKGMDFDRFLARMKEIHAMALRFGAEEREFLASALIDSYARSGRLLDARIVFESMDRINVVSWTGLMLGFVQTGQAAAALDLFAAMQDEGVDPDRVAVLAALRACAMIDESNEAWTRTNSLEESRVHCEDGGYQRREASTKGLLDRAKLVHRLTVKRGYDEEAFVANTLVDMYSKLGSMDDAKRVFESMRKSSVVSWSSLVLGYARCGQSELGLDLFSIMQAEGCVPNAVTYLAAIKACVSLADRGRSIDSGSGKPVQAQREKCLRYGRIIHSRAAKDGFSRDLFVSNALIDMHAKCGSIQDAKHVFDAMTNRDSVSWTSIIQGYVDAGESEQALQLFDRMRNRGFVAEAATFIAALRACASLGALDRGRQIYDELRRFELDKNTIVWSCLIDFFGKCGSMAEAESVFLSVPRNHGNLVGWSALIAGYSSQGDADTVFDLFERMIRSNHRLQPDGVIFLLVLGACCHAGLIDKAKHLFEDMSSRYGIAPNIQHYCCMVDIFGRGNHLDDAVAMIRSMPIEPNQVIWTTLLDASQRWNNARVGRLAFDSLLELGNVCASTYVTMANIYIAAGMRDEAKRLKALTVCRD